MKTNTSRARDKGVFQKWRIKTESKRLRKSLREVQWFLASRMRYTEACAGAERKVRTEGSFLFFSVFLVSILRSGLVLEKPGRTLSAHTWGGKSLGLFDDVSVKHSWPSDPISHFRKSPREEQTHRKTQDERDA